jgi:CobQ-like glutamine amidotransferase family enzyme
LLPVETRRSFAPPGEPLPPRAVGDIVVEPDPALGLPLLLGYENHGGRTRPVEGAKGKPLGVVRRGIGNGTPDHAEGWVIDRVLATYLHGPVLAQNPALADLLLRWVHPDLPPLDAPAEADVLRAARMRALGV